MQITEKAVKMGLAGGRYLLDGLNQTVITDEISFTVITRTFLDNNHFLLEVVEYDTEQSD